MLDLVVGANLHTSVAPHADTGVSDVATVRHGSVRGGRCSNDRRVPARFPLFSSKRAAAAARGARVQSLWNPLHRSTEQAIQQSISGRRGTVRRAHVVPRSMPMQGVLILSDPVVEEVEEESSRERGKGSQGEGDGDERSLGAWVHGAGRRKMRGARNRCTRFGMPERCCCRVWVASHLRRAG